MFNGDLGRVQRVDHDILYVDMDVGAVSYRSKEAEALALAYASTVHKVQGSEFPAIIILLHGSHHILLDRALLYTAITRAQRLAIIIGDDRALRRAVRNEASYHGHCRLAQRIHTRLDEP